MSAKRIKLMISIVDLAAGTGTVVRNLGAGLKRIFPDEFEVLLLTFRDEKITGEDRSSFDQSHSLHLRVRPGARQVLELPAAMARMRRAIRELQPDIILSVHTFANWLTSRCAGDVPMVLTDHINLTQRQAARGKSPIAVSLMRGMYQKHLAIGVSHDITYDLQLNFGAKRTATILNGVDVEKIRALSREPAKTPIPSPYIVAVGRLFPQKDYPTLIRAYQSAGLTSHLVIVGEGPERASIEKLIGELNLRNVVHLIGHQQNPFPYIRAARMLALSSAYEGFGMVLAEALALGVPCVSTDCPSGPSEILAAGEFGLLVPPQDPKKLAEAMARLDSNENLRQQFISKSNDRAMQLGVEPMARKYREVLLAELKKLARQPDDVAMTDWRRIFGDHFRDARCLVTGGAGFIGSHVVQALSALDAKIVVLDNLVGGDRNNIAPFKHDFIQGSILDKAALDRATRDCKYVFHLAALGSVPHSVENPLEYHQVDATGTLMVLESARHAKVHRVMYSASSSAYGQKPALAKVETMATDPLSPYAAAKLAGEGYMTCYAASYGLDTVSLRYFNIFGPRQNPNSAYAAVIAAFAKAIIGNKPPTIFGDGEQSRDFTFVHNAVHANLLAARHDKPLAGEILNVACGTRVSLNQLAPMMCRLLGRADLQPRYGPERAGDVKHSLADLSRIKQVLGYEPVVNLETGLGETLKWYKSVLS